jgi:outer membrane protein assembly factor BamE (lipoprotein component of BamABCDE complex)
MLKIILKNTLVFSFLSFVFIGCTNNQNITVKMTNEKLTVAKAQSSLKKGMNSSEVLEIMGSPNIISTDRIGNEVWVYDKMSSQSSTEHVSLGIGFIPGIIMGSTKSNISSQSTLTIIIKYNSYKEIEKISYHTSRF